MHERTHHIYCSGQLFLALLTNCTKIAYDNYNIIKINETFISNFFKINNNNNIITIIH
jgi:hypothetical protein